MEFPATCLFPIFIIAAIIVVPIYLGAVVVFIAVFVAMPAASVFAMIIMALEGLLKRLGPLTHRRRLLLLAIFNIPFLLPILAVGTIPEWQPNLLIIAAMIVVVMILVDAILVLGLEHGGR